ncbi:multicomponent Na+:H+ antiporter subunit F [Halogranum rubrum]|uniref:Multicomponent Na+:H+ antiporter subunit F n=2 Tax=Halogranum rubrum TaxID=553466 RepID=A0A1I4EKN3_9EURY|nr:MULTISPECIES: cation:proton antiporter [Halogranum]EJN60385.1 monovalent cation/H+ antiporter subunit F [Halogranum salarium B-1]SFL06288.1 multicomponent Na+:H+ antiporter subunit F [Halogranum rubrum]
MTNVTPLVSDVLLGAAAAFVALAIVVLYRVVKGPTMQDRVIAVNVIGSNTVVILALVAAAFGEPGYLDVALVYALLNFLMSIAISKFTVERGGVI